MLPTKVDVLVCKKCGQPIHARVASAKNTTPCGCPGEREMVTKKMLSSVIKGAGTLLRARADKTPLLIWS
jgi:hypothetical protein